MHSPRHTPEHISLLLFDAQQSNKPFALFIGDTLFNLAVGTPICLARAASENWSASCSTPSLIVTCRLATGWTSIPAMALAQRVESRSVTGVTQPLATSGSSTLLQEN
ncbi:MAG: hypothetical protein R3355_22940 [Pseudomonas sp.]|uniref:hypothetical protein n=1 Tax=Pseudomonas sp. TaxID=306 RepID=UPI00299ED7A4|nr:hypothetical protein [Pseudomonas sp.]MDX1725952.1 hypothetical protein [Pseudomonas sp.]